MDKGWTLGFLLCQLDIGQYFRQTKLEIMFAKIHYILPFLFLSNFTHGQLLKKQTLSQLGSSQFVYGSDNQNFFLQELAGQLSVIHAYKVGGYTLRQGFIQPISSQVISNQIDGYLKAKIFPNPFSDRIALKFNEPIYDMLNVYLFDISGRLVFNREYHPMQTLELNLYRLDAGSYLMRVQMREESLASTLIKR